MALDRDLSEKLTGILTNLYIKKCKNSNGLEGCKWSPVLKKAEGGTKTIQTT